MGTSGPRSSIIRPLSALLEETAIGFNHQLLQVTFFPAKTGSINVIIVLFQLLCHSICVTTLLSSIAAGSTQAERLPTAATLEDPAPPGKKSCAATALRRVPTNGTLCARNQHVATDSSGVAGPAVCVTMARIATDDVSLRV
jgi:hypothetical protein